MKAPVPQVIRGPLTGASDPGPIRNNLSDATTAASFKLAALPSPAILHPIHHDSAMTTTNPEAPDPTYTVFIRLPFPRGDFVDPPPVYSSPKCDRRR